MGKSESEGEREKEEFLHIYIYIYLMFNIYAKSLNSFQLSLFVSAVD